MTLRLRIDDRAYTLASVDAGAGTELARLPAVALLDPRRGLGEAQLEGAIDVAEDWLMPHASTLRGESLDVEDVTGRLRRGLREVLGADGDTWSVDGMEALFQRLVALATGRAVAPVLAAHPEFVGDLLLLRELAHHMQLRQVRLTQCPASE